MTQSLHIGGRSWPLRSIVFDKDGTLVDFHRLWGVRAEQSAEALLSPLSVSDPHRDAIRTDLYHTLGYQVGHGTLPGSPWATAPVEECTLVAASVLYRNGIIWDDAVAHARRYFMPVLTALPGADALLPRGNLPLLFENLRRKDIVCCVATTDIRSITEHTLAHFSINQHFAIVSCGDDRDRPAKPSVDALQWIADRTGIPLSETAMVGDTMSDMRMATEAGTALRIGIRGGACDPDELQPWTDVLVDSLDEIQVSE